MSGQDLTVRQDSTPRAQGDSPRRSAWLFGAVALVAVAAAAWAASGGEGEAEAGQERVTPVASLRWQPVTSYVSTHAFTGRLRAPRRSELGFERGGRLVEVLVREGAVVEVGQTLARLDRASLEARRGEAAARLAAARARLTELEAGPRQAELASARARVRELESSVSLARSTQKRQVSLAEQGVVSSEILDQAESRLGVEEARLTQAREALRLLEEGTRQEQLAAQRAQVLALEATLASLEVDLAQCELKAPFAGQVGAVARDPGSVLAAGTPVLALTEGGPLEVWIGVPAGPLESLATGSEHMIDIEGRCYPARVEARLPELDRATRTGTVILSLGEGPTDGPALLPEQVVRLVLARELPSQGGGWVPTGALSRGDRAVWSVLAIVPGAGGAPARVERRLVEVLHTDPDRALVRGDLAAGDLIVADGVHRVVPGQAVRVR